MAYALSLLAGAVLPLAFAPYGQFWVAPLSYAALFHAWGGASPWRAFKVGLLFGLGSFGFGTYWTYIAIHDFGGAPIAFAVAAAFALVLILALFIAAAGWVVARWFDTRGTLAWLVALPAVFGLAEWLRGWAFTGFGWLSAGYSQTDTWLAGFAPVLGLPGVSLAVFVTAGGLLTVVAAVLRVVRASRDAPEVGPSGSGAHIRVRARSREARTTRSTAAAAPHAAIAIAVVAVIWGIGLAAREHQWTQPKERELRVALIQGAIAQDEKWTPAQLPGTLALYRGLTEQNADADLIVWPEAAIPDLYERQQPFLEELQRWSERHGSAVMLGILRRPPAGSPPTATFQNVLIALTEPRLTYVKRHLVPFGEYYPVPGFMRTWLQLLRLPYTDGVPGDDAQPPLDLAGERIAVTICYEDVFGAEQLRYLADATLLVNVSNDAWYGDSIAPHQHLQIARLRAAEAGRYLLRATNTGVTAVIDEKGHVVARVPQFEAAVLTHTVRGYTGVTPYARWGNYPVVIAAALAALGAALVRQRRNVRAD
jgi:apolipoprotein N-acyltransferase